MVRCAWMLTVVVLLVAAQPVQAAQETPVGRPVRIVSIGFKPRPAEEIVPLVDEEAAKGCDLVILPETCTGNASPETLDGPVITAMSSIAKKHRTYIVCAIDRTDGERRLNSAVLLDRAGAVAAVYDKVYPFWAEFDLDPPVTPGSRAVVVETDFGKLGLAICFDANFAPLWRSMADQGAELVAFSSAYSAGETLKAHALNHQYYVVSSTWKADCYVFDITGEELVHERADGVNVSWVTLDLDRGIYHIDYNVPKREKMFQENPDAVELEQTRHDEAWFVLKAKQPGVSARQLAAKYGLEELRGYRNRSMREIDAMRGHPFNAGPAMPTMPAP